MIGDFGAIALFLIVAVIFPIFAIGLPAGLKQIGVIPNNPSDTKYSTYECGMKPIKQAWVQFNFRFYMFAILFVAMDIMSVFLYPWAVRFGGLSGDTQTYSFYGMFAFILILVVGLAYAWKKKALEWS